MKYLLLFLAFIYSYYSQAQSNSLNINEKPNTDLTVLDETIELNLKTNIDSTERSQKEEEQEQFQQELKNRGLQNFQEENSEEKVPVKYYIILKAFSNEGMAKKYIASLEANGMKSLKIFSEKDIHRVYSAVAFKPEEAIKLKEVAKSFESEAWVMEKPF